MDLCEVSEQRFEVEVVAVPGAEHAQPLARAFGSHADGERRQMAAVILEVTEVRHAAAVRGALFFDRFDDWDRHAFMVARRAQGSTAFGMPGDAPGSTCGPNEAG